MRLTSCPLVQSLTVFLLLKVAGPTCSQNRWPHLKERVASKVSYMRYLFVIGGSKWPLFRPGVCFRSRKPSLVQLTRMGSLEGFLDNSKVVAGCCSFGWAWLGTLKSLFGPGVDFCGRFIGRIPFGKTGQMVSNGVIGANCR